MYQLLFKGKIILRANAHWAWSSLLRLRIYFAFSKLLWESGTWWLMSFIMNSHQRSMSKKYTTHCNLADSARFSLRICLCEFGNFFSNDDFFSNTNKKIIKAYHFLTWCVHLLYVFTFPEIHWVTLASFFLFSFCLFCFSVCYFVCVFSMG